MTEPKRFCALCKLLLEEHEYYLCAECASTQQVKMNNVKISSYRAYINVRNSACDGCRFDAWCRANLQKNVTLPCYPEDERNMQYLAQGAETAQLEMEFASCAT